MRVLRSATASLTTLVSLGALYTLVVTLAVLLSNRVLVDPLALDRRVAWVLLTLGGAFLLVLVSAIGLSIVRIVRDRRSGRPGSTLKARLSAFFAIIVLLSAVPQGVVSVGFLSSALGLLFSSGTGDALRGGLDLALDYYDREVRALQILSRDGTVDRVIADRRDELLSEPEAGEVWDELAQRIPGLVAFQIFDAAGQPLIFRGERAFRDQASPGVAFAGDDGSVVRTRIGAESVLRMVMRVDLGGGPEATPGVALLTARLPDRFDETARGLTRAVDIFAGLERLRTTFVLVVAVLYGVFASPILLLAVLAGFFMADRILRPIESLEDATRRVTEGDYSVRILSRPNDDLGLLVLSFNRMVTELDRARRRMAQAEKVQAWQEIAQRLAHEVKNPLTPIRLAAERLHRRHEAGAADFPVILERTVATIVREVDELTALLNEFRSFSRMPEPHREQCPLAPVVRDIGAIYRDDPAVTIDGSAVPEEMVLFADRGQLRQVLLNLVANAVEASLDRGRSVVIRIAAHQVRLGESEFTRIVVADNGPGIPEELRATLFEPYVTGKAHGTGLGLAIVERIVFDHDGRITVESAPGSGTTFVIDLPVEPAIP